METRIVNSRLATCSLGCLFSVLTVLAGCGGHATGIGGVPPVSAALKGRIMGGQFPVSGSQVQLYAVGSTGYGAGAKALLSPAAITDSDGNFTIADGAYTCPSDSTLTYLVATGGDPGNGYDNPAILMMTATGACGDLSSLSQVYINEVTTVASVYALAPFVGQSPFLGQGVLVGTTPTNAQGLINAFANVNNLVDITQGTSPGPSAPSNAIIPSAKIYTLANVLAYCVNSMGAPSGTQTCAEVQSQTTPTAGPAALNTLEAVLNLARNPQLSGQGLFNYQQPDAPFEPSLSTWPKDWLLPVTYKGGGLKYPASIAVDAKGNIWASNFCGSNDPCSSVTELSSTGESISPAAGFTDGTLWENYGLAIDIHSNIWVTNQQTSSVNSGHGSVSVLNASGQVTSPTGGFYGGGVDFPIAVATDTDGSVWTANQGDSTVSHLSNGGSALSPSGGWGASLGVAGPAAVAIDADHRAWFANQEAASGSVTSVSADGSQITTYSSGGYETSGVATDAFNVAYAGAKGHVWTANYSTASISELQLNSDGSVTVVSTGYTGGGLSYPNGIALDGAGNVWAANHGGNTLTELEGANGSAPGTALSNIYGFGSDANLREPYGIAIDASGNIWVSNFGLSTITQFVGAATPVKTPLIGPVQLP